ncbi:unnamed protein product [Cuscuta epithymum]|uniref:CASP-like protein n=1 Tax=Cuscuta epithymum TaxID=186058 RepID=A0AAV0FMQ5_9ASTE|nr:unnamed protein product [Cuscuta epithymum]
METKIPASRAERGMGVEAVVAEEEMVAHKLNNVRWADFALRLLALALTFTAALVLGLDKQTKAVTMQILPTLPPVNIPVTAKSHHLSAFVYFVVVNAVACAYAAVSLVLTLGNRKKKNGSAATTLMIMTLDLAMVALLFSSCGAAAAIGVMGYKGNSHVRWNKVCNVFDRFCGQAAAAIGISLAASIFFLLLVFFAALNLHKRLDSYLTSY